MSAIVQVPGPASMAADIADWISNNHLRILQAVNLNGGWEIWAQVELAFHLAPLWTNANNRNHQLLREQHIFNFPREKMDLWLLRALGSPTGTERNQGIELKCRAVSDSAAGFTTRVKEDMVKCQDGPRDAFSPADFYAVGITTNAADQRGWADIIDSGFRVNWYAVPQPNGGPATGLFMVWMRKNYV